MYAHINGTRIFFDVEGVGVTFEDDEVIEKEACFILHGGPGSNHLAYKNALTPLTKFLQLVYVDNRGSGFSDDCHEDYYTLDQNVEDLEALRQHLGLDKICLFGHSYGGMVAMTYALKYPQHTKALILVTTSPHHSFIDDAKKELLERGTPKQQAIAEHVWNGSFETEEQHIKFQQLLAPLYSMTYDDRQPKSKRKGKYSFTALNKGFGGFLREYDVTEGIKSLHVPTLVIGGRHDWITPVAHSYWIHELMPASELVILENSAHSVLSDEREKFLEVVLSFIERKIVIEEEM